MLKRALLGQKRFAVDVRVTPYQVRCDRRPWIGKEEKKFVAILKRLGVDVTRKVYFEDEEPSVDSHFKVLTTFNDQQLM